MSPSDLRAPGLAAPVATAEAGDDGPALPDYGGACICNVVPALLGPPGDAPDWVPAEAVGAERTVLVVLDGLGWEQLLPRRHLAPTLAAMAGGPVSSVLPTTTAVALTSLSTGATPGEHGVVGYRMSMEGRVMNVLRWTTKDGDARESIPPRGVQHVPAFEGSAPPVVTRTEFATTGFTTAHLDGARLKGWRTQSTLVTEVAMATRAEERFTYAYYDGVDKVAHEYGLAEHYDAELAAADRMVADIIAAVPSGTAVVVTADHGQVDVGDDTVAIDQAALPHVSYQSGEARFRWLHARPGRTRPLVDAVRTAHGHQAWVLTRDEMIDDGWFGPRVSGAARARLGDVALVPKGRTSFVEPSDSGPFVLVGRHGSATRDELHVPLVATVT